MYQLELETMASGDLKTLQLERLKASVERIRANNSAYATRIGGPDLVRSLDDLRQFNFLTKEDVRQSYPFALTCAPRASFVRIQTSSGTTGTPVLNAYTANDVAQWSEIMARCLTVAGVAARDVFQIMPSFGLFNGGFGFHFGVSAIGAMIVPIGAGRTELQLQLMQEMGTTAIGAIASYPLRLMEVARERGFDFRRDTQLRVGIFGAEIWSDELRARIENGMGIGTFDIIGMTETGGVGLGIDCAAHAGVHIWEDHYLVEIIDPQTGDPLPDGQRGEMVITTLTREGLPLIRFRTGDLNAIRSREKCACGRTHLRVDRLTGRIDDMVKVKGINFYPKQVEALLLRVEGVATDYQIILSRVDGKDDCTILVEVQAGYEGLAEKLRADIYEYLGFHATVQTVALGMIARPAGKALRVVDKRSH
jgi:phenylacetate-coenzyme A ligase PaaK-like adenylate-forming protein